MDHNNDTLLFNALILSKVEEYSSSHIGSFCSPDSLKLDDWAPLLSIIISSGDSSQHMSLESCKDFICRNATIAIDLNKAYALKSFWAVKATISDLLQQESKEDLGSGTLTSGNSGQSIQDAFQDIYEGDLPEAFIDTLDTYAASAMGPPAKERAYNKSIPIIQSSGTGKSRMVEEAAKHVFTIPINIREDLPIGTYGKSFSYPPSDVHLRRYFEGHEYKSDDLLQAGYTIFFKLLFDSVIDMAKTIENGSRGPELAAAWAKHLGEGQNISSVGPNRKKLYSDVINRAESQVASLPTIKVLEEGIYTLKDSTEMLRLHSDLKKSWQALEKFLVPHHRNEYRNVCFVYFDEAHALTKLPYKLTPSRSMSPYHNLGRVLSELHAAPIFFIFLSTNSHLQQFAPPPANHPSVRVNRGHSLFPPFTELPFDVFVTKVLRGLEKSPGYVSLTIAQGRRVMSCFGRPMWHLHYTLWRKQQEQKTDRGLSSNSEPVSVPDVLTFAIDKLTAQGSLDKTPQSKLAAIGVRIGISFDSSTYLSCQAEAQHVESHMRIVYAIPEHRKYMRTCCPSEPVLAEAAARYLDQRSKTGIAGEGPRVLAENCQNGILARGERGELCGRLLVTIAHDIAIKQYIQPRSLVFPQFHRPVPVLDFLRALFASNHHTTVLGATPVASSFLDGPNQPPTLEETFRNTFIFFSHFELAKDSQVLDASLLPYALLRGYALQAKAGQVSIDAVIPVHMGSEDSPITPETTSAINLQFKNRKQSETCPVNRSITVPNHKLPVISIVFELGEQSPSSSFVGVYHEDHRITRNQPVPHRDDLHFTLVARGCGPDTFNAVSEDAKSLYDIILSNRDMLDDFPRNERPKSVAFLDTFSPAWSSSVSRHATLFKGRSV
ncbi:hypothetical protein RhiTH_011472 [Rhizoctonia solani]